MENYDSYGKEAEKAVLNYILENSGFKALRTEFDPLLPNNPTFSSRIDGNIIHCSRLARLKGGDIFLYPEDTENIATVDPIRINVVRGTWVSQKALLSYRGGYYCLFPDGDISDPSQARIIMRKTMETFYHTCVANGRPFEMIGLKEGYRYNTIHTFITLQNFLSFLTKIQILGYLNGTMEYYKIIKSPWWSKKEKQL